MDATALSEWALAEALVRETWYDHFAFKAGPRPSGPLPLDKCFELCPELVQINNIAEIQHIGVIKMAPGDFYKMHTDTVRGVGINMMVFDEHSSSLCAFVNRETFETEKLDYQPNTMYLFNTQIPHTIFNFEGYRYMLAVSFLLPKELLPYRHIKKLIRKINLA